MNFNRIAIVTGGAGFIGNHVCQRLKGEGAYVICVDDLSSACLEPSVAHENILRSIRCEETLARIRRSAFKAWTETPAPVEIWHLACPASPVAYKKRPVETLLTSVVGTHNMLVMASWLTQYTEVKMLFTSTSEVYGDPHVHPQSESYFGNVNIRGSRSCYDEGKRAAETLCNDFMKAQNPLGKPLDVRTVRLFNTYGPGMAVNDGRVVSNFINQALDGEPLTVYGDGLQTRSLCYIDDTVEALFRYMALDTDTPGIAGPFNVGNTQEVAVCVLADFINHLTSNEAGVCHKPTDGDDPHVRCPNTWKFYELTQWKPTVDMKEGIQRTVDYFKRLREAGRTNFVTYHPELINESKCYTIPSER